MKQSVKLVMMFMALAAITSCVDLNWDEKKQENANNSFFAKMVGRIDPNHTWNLSKESSVTISTASATDVKIYSFDGKSYRLLASKNIDGTEKINFDIFCGINEVYVENRSTGAVRKASLGSSVSFSGTRSVDSSCGNDKVKVALTDFYYEYNYAGMKSTVETNDFIDPDNATPLYLSQTDFTLFPVWFTSNSGVAQEFGLYYYENGQMVQIKLWCNDKGQDMFQFYDKNDNCFRTYSDAHMPSLANYDNLSTIISNNVRARGFKVSVADGLKFGFYVKGNDQGSSYFSEDIKYNLTKEWQWGNLNQHFGGEYGKTDKIVYYEHFALINYDGHCYLGCDDGCEITDNHSKVNPEYFHLVFEIGNQFGTPVNPGEVQKYITDSDDPYTPDEPDDNDPDDDDIIPTVEDGEWLIACEDVFTGSLNSDSHCDYDFNDVVFSVKHIAGESTATLTFLAAGSTIANYIYFGDIEIGEIHALLKNSEKDAKGAYTMLNTRINGASAAPQTTTISVPANFSMANNMGGFKIVRKVSNNKSIESITTGAPKTGSVPYMICVPADWKWPVENQTITGVYSDFATWCADHESATNWYTSSDESKVFKFPSKTL